MTTQISETLHHEYCKNISLVLTYYHKSCAYFVAYSQTLTKEVIRLKKKILSETLYILHLPQLVHSTAHWGQMCSQGPG